MRYRCPVCMYDALPYPPTDYHICPCCGTEFGNDDEDFSHEQLREMWITSGAHWFFGNPPPDWNWFTQLCGPGFILLSFTGFILLSFRGTETEIQKESGALRTINKFEYSVLFAGPNQDFWLGGSVAERGSHNP